MLLITSPPILLCAPLAQFARMRKFTGLDRLEAAELVFCEGAPPSADYMFKHALVRDAANGTLLRSTRQQLHGHIAATIEAQFQETVKTTPELLA